MEKLFKLLSKVLSHIATWCEERAGIISHNKSRKQSIEFGGRQFVSLVRNDQLKQLANNVCFGYISLGISSMDLAMAFGWMRSHGTEEKDVLDKLGSYLKKELNRTRLQELLLDHIIQRPGSTLKTS